TNSSVNSSPHHLLPRGKVVCPFQDGRENSFAIYHPQVKTIAHPITVTFQRFTAEGCVYTLKYPVRNPNTRRLENALAKTPRLDLQSKTFTEQERTALERTGALFFSGMNEGREWFLTKKYDGFRLIDHPVYQTMFPALYNEVNDGASIRGTKAFLDCEAFMEGEYVRLVNSLNAYVLDSSVVPAHLNWDFFLLSPTMDNRAPKYINTNWEHAQVWEPFASTVDDCLILAPPVAAMAKDLTRGIVHANPG
ncbi:hypothetical protein FRB99_000631, partial [Tulasnella sp. 403]